MATPASSSARQFDPQQLVRENRRLRQALNSLGMLDAVASAATSDLSADAIINLIIEKSVEGLDAEQGALHLFDEASLEPRVTTLVRYGHAPAGGVSDAVAGTLLGWAVKEKRPLRSNDLSNDRRFRVALDEVRSVLSVPLLWKNRTVGLLSMLNKLDPDGFTEEDERALAIIASQSAHVLRAAQRIGALRQDAERLQRENAALKERVGQPSEDAGFIGSAPPIRELLRMVDRISGVNVDVLITGESGTGKELIARTIHNRSPRAAGPFVGINCAALPETLLEAELFGVGKNIATGVDRRPGHFENAHGGTLFLDEIGDLSLGAQAKILRVLQERCVRRLGGAEEIPIDVRIVAATHAPLEDRMRTGAFREDLFYRLNVIRLKTPALREMPGDIELLARHFLALACRQIGREGIDLSAATVGALQAYHWPGNIRQLRNEMKRLAICVLGDLARPEHLSDEIRAAVVHAASGATDFEARLATYERSLLEAALSANDGNQARAASALGLSRSGLLKKMKRLGLSNTKA